MHRDGVVTVADGGAFDEDVVRAEYTRARERVTRGVRPRPTRNMPPPPPGDPIHLLNVKSIRVERERGRVAERVDERIDDGDVVTEEVDSPSDGFA